MIGPLIPLVKWGAIAGASYFGYRAIDSADDAVDKTARIAVYAAVAYMAWKVMK